MVATIVQVFVNPDFVNLFIEATEANHRQSILEIGNFRFDILQDITTPGKFVLYEVYESDEQAALHKQTAHYMHWRDQVASWMERPREGTKYVLLFPQTA